MHSRAARVGRRIRARRRPLAQAGAVGMAEKGASYEEILRHYYRGIELARWF